MRHCLRYVLIGLILLLPGIMQAQETGIIPFKKAVPFDLPTTEGDFLWTERWTGEDSWMFLFLDNGNSLSTALWSSISSRIFQRVPDNVYIFFGSYSNTRVDADMMSAKQKIDAALSSMSASSRAYWESRIFYITETVDAMDNWVGEVLRNNAYAAFNIDRFQRLRENGLLYDITASNPSYDYAWAGNEPLAYNFEYEREQQLNQYPVVEITIIDHDYTNGNRFSGDIILPDSATMAQFDKMEIEMEFGCDSNIDGNCFEWDYLANLYLCDDEDPSLCKQEIGRWITSYHRTGLWVTDYTPFLAFLKDGGLKHFRFNTQDRWIVTAKLRLINTGSANTPAEIIPLMADSLYNRVLMFNETYNDYFPPVTFTVPEWVTKAEVAAIITGHGFAGDVANCAEFCNHQHWFDVNGIRTYKKEHPEAQTRYGCMAKIDEGVTPNQYGTWPYGRGGWCPGQDVPPFRADITSSLIEGENTITYRGLFNGQTYVPEYTEGTFKAQLRTANYLVLYKSKPVGVEQPQHSTPGFFTLHQNYPNPFRDGTVIEYDVRKAGNVSIAVYDAMGRKVRTLVDGHKEQGAYKYRFEAVDMIPGVYWYTLHGNGWTESKRMIMR